MQSSQKHRRPDRGPWCYRACRSMVGVSVHFDTVATLNSNTNAAGSQSGNLDGQGNWSNSTTDTTTQIRSTNAQNRIDTPTTGTNSASLYYDDNEKGRLGMVDAWEQQNSAGYVGAENLYEFVGSKPDNRVDPSGCVGWIASVLSPIHITWQNDPIWPMMGPKSDSTTHVRSIHVQGGLSAKISLIESAAFYGLPNGCHLRQDTEGWSNYPRAMDFKLHWQTAGDIGRNMSDVMAEQVSNMKARSRTVPSFRRICHCQESEKYRLSLLVAGPCLCRRGAEN